MKPTGRLTEEELDELDEFLTSEKVPPGTMDVAQLDGLLTALAIGPKLVMPSRWSRMVWGGSEDGMPWESEQEAQHIIGLIMRLYNQVNSGFWKDPPDFLPIFDTFEDKQGNEQTLIGGWCSGFMKGVGISVDDWAPMLESVEHRDLITAVFHHGTEEGRKALATDPKFDGMTQEKWLQVLLASVLEIDKFWRPYRLFPNKTRVPASVEPVGRNAPCPCGSGQKFKKCCGSPSRVH